MITQGIVPAKESRHCRH